MLLEEKEYIQYNTLPLKRYDNRRTPPSTSIRGFGPGSILRAGIDLVGAVIETEDYRVQAGWLDIKEELVSQYNLTANVNDSHGTNNLTNNGTVTFGADGAILNGSSKYLTHASLALVDAFTVAAQFKTTSTGSNQVIVAKNATGQRQFEIAYDSVSGKIIGKIFDSSSNLINSVTSEETIIANTNYTVIMWHNGYLNLQINAGNKVMSAYSATVINLTSTAPFSIGLADTRYFAGTIKNVRVWDECLSSEQRGHIFTNPTSFVGGTAPRYTNDGAIMAPEVANLLINGDWSHSAEIIADGIRSYSNNINIDSIILRNLRGTGIRIGRGTVGDQEELYDFGCNSIRNVRMSNVRRGLYIDCNDLILDAYIELFSNQTGGVINNELNNSVMTIKIKGDDTANQVGLTFLDIGVNNDIRIHTTDVDVPVVFPNEIPIDNKITINGVDFYDYIY